MTRLDCSSVAARFALLQVFFLLLVLFPVPASGEPQDRPVIRAGLLPEDFQFTGAVDDPAWRDADAIENLTTTEPTEGGVPAGRTIVRVLANGDNIIIGVICEDPEPDGVVSFSKARDSMFRGEDNIRIVLDTFLDGRSGYLFAVNPEGARFDALVTGGEHDNSNWDAIWEAKISRDARGWSAEIKIPLKSLSFNSDLREWGFNIERQVQRLQEVSRWASPRRDYRINQTSLAGLLTDLPDFNLGVGLSIRPAIVVDIEQPEIDATTDYDGDVSLDVTQRVGSNLISSLTINTDFAETEVDTRKTNLTRFPLFFPEKRTFFLEGADIFQFGSSRSVLAFHSRRIGLLSGEEVPLRVGGKLNGRIGGTNLGALVANTGEVEDLVSPATMGVVRIDQNIFAESSVGMIATFGDPENRQGAWTAGADFTYRTSHFRGDKNFVVGGWALAVDREDLEGDKTSFGLLVDYPNDDWDNFFSYTRVGDGFDPSLGFVPRRAIQSFNGGLNYRNRPDIPWVRWMYYELRPILLTYLEGNWQS